MLEQKLYLYKTFLNGEFDCYVVLTLQEHKAEQKETSNDAIFTCEYVGRINELIKD